MPQNSYLDDAMIENNSENENENEQNQTQQTQNQTQNQTQAIEQLNQQLQQMQINNNNLEPLHQLGPIAAIPEEQNMPQYVNNSQINNQGGKRRKSYRKKNRKTRRKVRKTSNKKRY